MGIPHWTWIPQRPHLAATAGCFMEKGLFLPGKVHSHTHPHIQSLIFIDLLAQTHWHSYTHTLTHTLALTCSYPPAFTLRYLYSIHIHSHSHFSTYPTCSHLHIHTHPEPQMDSYTHTPFSDILPYTLAVTPILITRTCMHFHTVDIWTLSSLE